jgi:hypothetical protein
MDKEIKNKVVSLVVAMLGLIAFANLVSGVLSDPPLHITEIGVDSVNYGGVEYENWTHDNLFMGVTYDSGLEVFANEDVNDFYMVAQFEKPGIQPGDAVIQYWNGTAWADGSCAITEATLTYTFPDTHYSIVKGDSMVILLLVTFQQCGNYTSRMWLEGMG